MSSILFYWTLHLLELVKTEKRGNQISLSIWYIDRNLPASIVHHTTCSLLLDSRGRAGMHSNIASSSKGTDTVAVLPGAKL
eukprot:SAG22_NODE_494_length_9810_cov_2.202966_10_plen_81_part_00